MAEYFNLLEESFPGIKANIARYEELGFSWENRKHFLREEGEVVAYACFSECPLLVEGQSVPVGVLHAICTKATHRGQGLATGLIREALAWAQVRYQTVILFTEIPRFYERISFRAVQEYRFHLRCRHTKGRESLKVLQDKELFLRCFKEREPLSDHFCVQDQGEIAAFNTLWTYPEFWSLYYSVAIDGLISYQLEGTTLHLFDVVAKKMPSLDLILDHVPGPIEEIYFYFSPDRFTKEATAQPHLYDKCHLMVHGEWPYEKPFIIQPLSRF